MQTLRALGVFWMGSSSRIKGDVRKTTMTIAQLLVSKVELADRQTRVSSNEQINACVKEHGELLSPSIADCAMLENFADDLVRCRWAVTF